MESLFSSRVSLALAVFTAIFLLRSIFAAIRWRSRSKGLPLPPGPRSLPIVGHLFSIPPYGSMRCERYAEMAKEHGDIIYLEAVGQRLLILGSSKVALDLLEKRSSNYSDRPKSIVMDYMGGSYMFSLLPYGPWWRALRREFWQQFYPGMINKYDFIQRQEVRRFLQHLLDDPSDFRHTLRQMVARFILRAVYNIDTRGRDDPVLTQMDEGIEIITANVMPGPVTALVEFLPILRFWPSFQRNISECKEAMDSVRDLPYVESKKRQVDPEYVSMVDAIQERLSKNDEQDPEYNEKFVKDVAGVTYAAGGETSFSTLQSFFLAMSLYPEVQKKAQAEIDTKIGRSRLPDIYDVDDLPYVGAMVKELLRWQNVTPFGVPHASIEDDVYNGYFIPAGTVVMANIWAILHDPEVYPEPLEFKPERFLKDGQLDPQAPDPAETFGFGRRICPGRHFAERSIFLAIASVLSAFSITPPLNDKGEPFHIEARQTDNQISYPVDCRCTITPRSEAAVSLVRQVPGA